MASNLLAAALMPESIHKSLQALLATRHVPTRLLRITRYLGCQRLRVMRDLSLRRMPTRQVSAMACGRSRREHQLLTPTCFKTMYELTVDGNSRRYHMLHVLTTTSPAALEGARCSRIAARTVDLGPEELTKIKAMGGCWEEVGGDLGTSRKRDTGHHDLLEEAWLPRDLGITPDTEPGRTTLGCMASHIPNPSRAEGVSGSGCLKQRRPD